MPVVQNRFICHRRDKVEFAIYCDQEQQRLNSTLNINRSVYM